MRMQSEERFDLSYETTIEDYIEEYDRLPDEVERRR